MLCAGGVDVIAAAPMEETVKREFEELFREHFQFVYCTAYTVTGSSQDAEDVIQTVFMKLLQQHFLLRARDNPKPYLYRAAINASLNIIRSRKRLDLTSDFDRFDTLRGDGPFAPGDAAASSLVKAMSQLNPLAVEILVLRYEHNYSDAQIAKMLGKSRGMIAVTLYRARKRLKRLLQTELGDKL